METTKLILIVLLLLGICQADTKNLVQRSDPAVVIADVNISVDKLLEVVLQLNAEVGTGFNLDVNVMLSTLGLRSSISEVQTVHFLGQAGEIVTALIDLTDLDISADVVLEVSLGNLELDIDLDVNIDLSDVVHDVLGLVDGVLTLVGGLLNDLLGSLLPIEAESESAKVSIIDIELNANILGITLKLDTKVGTGFNLDVNALLSTLGLRSSATKSQTVHFLGNAGEVVTALIDLTDLDISAGVVLEVSMGNLQLDVDLDVNIDLSDVVSDVLSLVDGVLTLVGGILDDLLGGLLPSLLGGGNSNIDVPSTQNAVVSLVSAEPVGDNIVRIALNLDTDVDTGFNLDVNVLVSVSNNEIFAKEVPVHFEGIAGEVVVDVDLSEIELDVELDLDVSLGNLVLDLDLDISIDISDTLHEVLSLVDGILSIISRNIFQKMVELDQYLGSYLM